STKSKDDALVLGARLDELGYHLAAHAVHHHELDLRVVSRHLGKEHGIGWRRRFVAHHAHAVAAHVYLDFPFAHDLYEIFDAYAKLLVVIHLLGDSAFLVVGAPGADREAKELVARFHQALGIEIEHPIRRIVGAALPRFLEVVLAPRFP